MKLRLHIIEEAKREFMKARKSHDWEHTERVYKLCMHIGEKEGANLEILAIVAYLHDIGREEQDKNKGKVCHALIGAQKANIILKKYNYPEDFREKVIHCIQTHRFRGNDIPQTLEAKVLYDADKLDAIGAIGIARAFVFAGEIGAKVHNKDLDIEKSKSYTEEDTAYREFMVKLRKIKDMLLTSEGRKIAESRHEFMLAFFERLNLEVDGVI